jgi:putative heme iron utilization protein
MDDVESSPSTDETQATEAASRDNPAELARSWLLSTHVATLCTTSVQRGIEGYPFGSVVPFALCADGRPFVLTAEIAAHTANLRRDPRAALFVRQPDAVGDAPELADPQAGWRLTVQGPLERLVGPGEARREGDVEVSAAEMDDLWARYLERVPAAASYRETHDFWFWRMASVVRGRYIAGFGKICWIDGAELVRDPGGAGLAQAAAGAVAHMNDDHRENMREMCAGLYGFSPEDAEMVGVDRAGFQVRTRGPERLLQFSFGREISAADLRRAVIDVLARARARAR